MAKLTNLEKAIIQVAPFIDSPQNPDEVDSMPNDAEVKPFDGAKRERILAGLRKKMERTTGGKES